jgi:hypothetical protein
MRVSFVINILTSIILIIAIIVFIKNYKRIENINQMIIILLLFATAVGIHGIQHSIEEIYYDFNPLAGKWKINDIIKESFTDSIDFGNFEIKDSKIHGVGIVSKINIPIDTVLFKCIENGKILTNARKINHCQLDKSNTTLIENLSDKCWYLKTIKDIKIGDEITCDYNTTPRHLIDRAKPEWKC